MTRSGHTALACASLRRVTALCHSMDRIIPDWRAVNKRAGGDAAIGVDRFCYAPLRVQRRAPHRVTISRVACTTHGVARPHNRTRFTSSNTNLVSVHVAVHSAEFAVQSAGRFRCCAAAFQRIAVAVRFRRVGCSSDQRDVVPQSRMRHEAASVHLHAHDTTPRRACKWMVEM